MTYAQTAEEFGPSVHFWRSKVWAGKIKNCGSDRRHLLDRKDIEKLIQDQKG